MAQPTDFLATNRCMIKLYEGELKAVCEQYRLALIEANVISFLYNNPEKDTAGDIAELRMLAKGNVSQAVDTLIQKRLLGRRQDPQDRRKFHLFLLPDAKPVTDAMEAVREIFTQEIFAGLSEEEQALFFHIQERIQKNAQTAMKRRNIL